MKRILFAFFLLTFLCFPSTSKALATNSSLDNLKVYFFYEENCKECDKGKTWLDNYLKDNNRVIAEYIKVSDNKELNSKIKDKLNIKKDDVPLFVIGSNYFIGFNNRVKSNLTEAIKSYENSSSYCDAVLKIQNDEDIKDCTEKNKNIYHENISAIAVIIIILIIIGIIVCLIKYVKPIKEMNDKMMKKLKNTKKNTGK